MLLRGHGAHRRWTPVRHELRLRLFMVYVDLAELDGLFDATGSGRLALRPLRGFAGRTTSAIGKSRSTNPFASWCCLVLASRRTGRSGC